jgi:hypothetical protein
MKEGVVMYIVTNSVRSITDDDGTTLLDLNSNQILGLNPTGSYIWQAVQNGKSLADIVNGLTQATRGCKEMIEADTREFLEFLTSKGLLSGANE